MMMDIFTSFDPNSIQSWNPNIMLWLAPFILTLILTNKLWSKISPHKFLSNKINSMMISQSSQTTIKTLYPSYMMISSLFFMLLILNLWGILPYTFSNTSHLMFALPLALPLWMSLVFSSFMNSFKTSLANFLPSGAPTWLNPFLIIIETISMMVRPLTLGFRLAANMSAGHIVLTLISVFLSSAMLSNNLTPISLTVLNAFYTMFEIAICLIQAFIFCLLITLYSNDHQ